MKKIKILIIEDEDKTALNIKNAIKNLGYIVSDIVTNYSDALQSAKNNKPDIVITDIYLNNSKSGIEIAKDIQKLNIIPIIFLTTSSDDKTIEKAISTNPIGYLLKPFKQDDLKPILALALYKISKKRTDSAYKYLGFNYYYNIKTNNLYCRESPVKLGIKEKLLLNRLVQEDGKSVSFKELEYLLWQNNPVSDSSLRTIIYRLRNKLEYKLIETIPSIGIRLINI